MLESLQTPRAKPPQTYVRRIAARFHSHCALHPNPLIGSIGQYNLSDLTKMYKRYKHKRPKHCLL
jgi:hypothetical protein